MKNFLIKLCIFVTLITMACSGMILFKYLAIKRVSWQLPYDVNTLFLGASHIQLGINNLLYPNSINMANSSERYMFTYIKLAKVISYENNINTIFLQFAPTDVWENTDVKYFDKNEKSYYFTSYFPYFTEEEWEIYSNSSTIDLLHLVLVNSYKTPNSYSYYGQYSPSKKIFNRNANRYKPGAYNQDTTSGHEINYHYLKKIISLCQQNNIKLYLLYVPVFEPEEYYDQEYFYNTYSTNFSEVAFLDYSGLNIPDEYRADEHHLNHVGADFFTQKLYNDIEILNGKIADN